MITYQQLRTFLTVIRAGSLTRAARELKTSQPTVSQQLGALGKFLGTTLLERSGKRVRLTHTGEMVRRYAEDALDGLRTLDEDVAALKGSPSGRLAVGATFILSHVLASVSSRFRAQFPGVVLQLHVDIPEALFDHLASGILDLACYVRVRTPPGLTVETVGDEEFVIIASPRHPLAGRRHISSDELSQQMLVVSRTGLFRESLEAKLRAIGVIPSAATEARNYDAVKTLVVQNAGYSVHVKRLVAAELATGRLVVLNVAGQPIVSEIVVAYRSGPAVSPLIQAVVPFFREELNPEPGG